jgi:hypothetical protein
MGLMVDEAEKANSKTLAYFAGLSVAKKNIFMMIYAQCYKNVYDHYPKTFLFATDGPAK